MYPRSGGSDAISRPIRSATVTKSAATIPNSSGSSLVLSTSVTFSAVPLEKKMSVDEGIATSSRKKYTAATTAACRSGNHANRRTRRGASRQPIPIPRKLASRMKFEKYERSRMCAGIHRINATSRKRTRKDARNVRTARM